MDVDSSSPESNESDVRLSELPISLTHSILSLLPMTDVVRTIILSKHWHNLWTTVPSLHLIFDPNLSFLSFRNFVDGAMRQWKGSKIFKFQLVCPNIDLSCSKDLDSCLIFAMENLVEELYLKIDHFEVPHPIYSCSSITKLTLVNCSLNFHENVQWHHLKSLTLQHVGRVDDMIHQILRGSPQLEILILIVSESYRDLNIESTSLKTLKIQTLFDYEYILTSSFAREYSTMVLRRLWAPNLETLEISGVFYGKHLLIDVSSLTNVTLRISHPMIACHFDQFLKMIIHHAENLTLSQWCTLILGGLMRDRDIVVSVPNVKFLKLCKSSVDDVISLLEIFPNLSKLVIEGHDHLLHTGDNLLDMNVFDDDMYEEYNPETNYPETYLLQLRTVEITWILHHHYVFWLIRTLLKNASMLEKIVFRVKGCLSDADREALPVVANMMHDLPRSSQSANVEFILLEH